MSKDESRADKAALPRSLSSKVLNMKFMQRLQKNKDVQTGSVESTPEPKPVERRVASAFAPEGEVLTPFAPVEDAKWTLASPVEKRLSSGHTFESSYIGFGNAIDVTPGRRSFKDFNIDLNPATESDSDDSQKMAAFNTKPSQLDRIKSVSGAGGIPKVKRKSENNEKKEKKRRKSKG
jgi:hypothetical protein